MNKNLWLSIDALIDLIVTDSGLRLNREAVHGEILRYLESYLGDSYYDTPEDPQISMGLVDRIRAHFKKYGYDNFKLP